MSTHNIRENYRIHGGPADPSNTRGDFYIPTNDEVSKMPNQNEEKPNLSISKYQ